MLTLWLSVTVFVAIIPAGMIATETATDSQRAKGLRTYYTKIAFCIHVIKQFHITFCIHVTMHFHILVAILQCYHVDTFIKYRIIFS